MMNVDTLAPPTDHIDFRAFFQNKNILITGASGFIGAALLQKLSHFNANIREYSFLSNTKQLEPILNGIDLIFHLSAQTDLQTSLSSPGLDYLANTYPTLSLIDTIRKTSCKPTIIFSSTASIYGIPGILPVSEDTSDSPLTFYDYHKKLSELAIDEACKNKEITGGSLRFTNIYGPGTPSKNSNRGILNQMIAKAKSGVNLQVYGKGNEIRDYLFIDDAITALLFAAFHYQSLSGEPYLIGSGIGTSIFDAACLIQETAARLFSQTITIHHEKPPVEFKINQRNFIANSSKFRTLTGWNPLTTLKTGVELTMRAHA